MAKTELPAEGLLKVRRRREDAARRELAECHVALQQVETELQSIDRERQDIEQTVTEPRAGRSFLGLQREYARYHALSVREEATRTRLEEAARMRERAREAAVTAQREVKTVERLRERAAEAEQKAQRRVETRALDEIGTRRTHLRKAGRGEKAGSENR